MSLPQWGWALFYKGSSEEAASVFVADSLEPPRTVLNNPVPLDRFDQWGDPDSQLTTWGWDRLTYWYGTNLRQWHAYRVRPAVEGRPPTTPGIIIDGVPYGHDAQWALDDSPRRGEGLWEDSTFDGPDPGYILSAQRTLQNPKTTPPDRQNALNRITQFNHWLREQIREHGWPDATHTTLSINLLNWVADDPNKEWRAECARLMRTQAHTGDVDPDQVATLEATLNPDLLA